MPHVEIVVHCWRYSNLLAYQASSLALYPPAGDVRVTLAVYCSREDNRTIALLDRLAKSDLPENVAIDRRTLETPLLMRRAIGRNLAARSTTAEVVWFADCDILFRSETFATLFKEIEANPEGTLYHPRKVFTNSYWADGDEAIEVAKASIGWIDIDKAKYQPRIYGRAIGGLQIVRGEVARKHGYVPLDRFQRPAATWRNTTEDIHFRRLLGPPHYAIDLPGVYRIRHSKRGSNDANCEN